MKKGTKMSKPSKAALVTTIATLTARITELETALANANNPYADHPPTEQPYNLPRVNSDAHVFHNSQGAESSGSPLYASHSPEQPFIEGIFADTDESPADEPTGGGNRDVD